MRIPGFFFAVVLLLAFTACGQSPEPNESTPPLQTPTEAATQSPTAYPTPALEVDASKPTSAANVTSTSATPVPDVLSAALEHIALERAFNALEIAIVNGDAESVQNLLQNLLQTGVHVTEIGNLLPFAIVRGNDEIVRILLEAGADPNATNIEGRTSLEIAIALDKTEVVRMLADAGADVNVILTGRLTVGGEDTVLGWAVKASGNLEIIRILVDAGADVAAKSDLFGQSAMEIAVKRGNAEIIEILQSAAAGQAKPPAEQARPPGEPRNLRARANGTDIDLSWRAPSEDGGSPVLGYRIEVSEDGSVWDVLLADTGSDDTSYTHSGLEGGSTRFYRVSAINTAGIGPQSSVSSAATELCGGRESLFRVIRSGEAENVQCLIRELGADVNANDDQGKPPLFWAILEESPEIVELLMEAGADVNATDKRGNPMLYWAILEESPEIVELLVEAGADVNAADASQGVSMLRWAIVKDNPEIVRILEEAGAKQ